MPFFSAGRTRGLTGQTLLSQWETDEWVKAAKPALHLITTSETKAFHLEGLTAHYWDGRWETHTGLRVRFQAFTLGQSISLRLRFYWCRASIKLQTKEEHAALVCLGFLRSALLLQPPSVLWNKRARCFLFLFSICFQQRAPGTSRNHGGEETRRATELTHPRG